MTTIERLDAILNGCREKFQEIHNRAISMPDNSSNANALFLELLKWELLFNLLNTSKSMMEGEAKMGK